MLNGKIARSELMPWNVAIYKNDKNKYNMICGGTLIAPKLVISGNIIANKIPYRHLKTF